MGPVNFRLELPSHWKIHDDFHTKLLHPYKKTEEYGETFMEPPPDLVDDEPEWEVEQILDERMQRSEKQYLIRWKGYSNAHDSWEPRENIKAPLLMAEFEERRSVQDKESAQTEDRVQKEAQKKSGRTAHSRTIYCDHIPLTPAHPVSPNQDLTLPSSSSSNSWADYHRNVITIHGPMHQCVNKEKGKVVPKDSASIRVSPTHAISNVLDVLASVRSETLPKEDMVIDHAQPDSFEEALQSFQAVQAELDDVLVDDDNGELDVSCQLGRRRAGPPKTMEEKTLEEVFRKQRIAGPSTTIEHEEGAGPLPLEDDESAVMSSLDSQLSDVAAYPGYPFWRYKRVLHSVPILLPDPITDRGIPQKADYVASNVEKHDEEPTTCPTGGTKA